MSLATLKGEALKLIARLDKEMERYVLNAYYLKNKGLSEIGKETGYSKSAVFYIKKCGLKAARELQKKPNII